MLMLKSTHEMEMLQMQVEYQILLNKWNNLVEKINQKGGQSFLDGEKKENQFSKGEINTLINLCHPDKHQQKESAVKITQKLLAMR